MTNKLFILFLACLYGFQAHTQNIEFIENKGQWDSEVKFMGQVNGGAFFIHQNGFSVLQYDSTGWEEVIEAVHKHGKSPKANRLQSSPKAHAYRVNFMGGTANPQIIADKPLYTRNNYFIGNDPSKWAADCQLYQGVTIKNIYPNIDIRYYSGSGNVKYDFIIHPGGNPADIALKYDGAQGLEIKNKDLIVKTSVGNLRELSPYTYQYNEAGRLTVPAKFTLKGNLVQFEVKNYNPKTTLVIDPDLIFCSFSKSTADNWGFTATYGPDGSMYGGGIVFAAGFPASTGVIQPSYGGGKFDIGIIKLSADGVNRVYATYIGGSGEDQPHSLVVTPEGELVLAGRTNSPRIGSSAYPVKNASTDLYGSGGGYDIIITKLSASGGTLVGSVRLGGTGDDGVNIDVDRGLNSLQRNYGDDGRSEVNLDAAGNVYVASCTQSTTGAVTALFPLQNPFQSTPGGAQDGVVIKFNASLSTLLISSFLGGNGNDAAYVVSINPLSGDIYVGGGSASSNLPGTGANTISSANAGSIDGFVSIINAATGAMIKTSFVGTATGFDQVYGIQFDEKGFPYIMGQTTGSWPIINAPWSQANGKQFIAKLQPDLSAYVYSTVFGKGQSVPDISPIAFLVDRCENVYISGFGGRLEGFNFPNAGVLGLTVTPDALKSTADPGPAGIGDDFYFFVLKKDAASQLYGSFFGQNGGGYPDHVDGGTSRFDRNGVIYQAMCASCGSTAPFPTTPGVWAPSKPASATCNLAMVKIAFNFAGIKGNIRPSINGVPRDSTGCVPLTVDFTDTIQDAPQYEWNFGDGSPTVATTAPSISHTYNNIGSYLVMMIAIDPTKCFPRDTTYTTVKVGDNQAIPAFVPVKLSPPCDAFRYRFDNTTLPVSGIPFRSQTFTWDFGDNSPRVTTDGSPVFHTYANAGTYNVRLILNDTSFCNSPDTTSAPVRVAATVKAVFTTPARGCAPYNAEFKNESVGGAQFTWNFGDGSAPQQINSSTVNHTYTIPGTYTITLVAVDSNTCNIIDSTRFTITVSSVPTADFSVSATQVNTPFTFTNLSSPDAVRFKWVFGDGDSLLTNSRASVQHEFNLTGTYNTCLTAYNAAGCPAQRCQSVSNTTEPAVDVPNAFTPQSGDNNSRVFVKGFGITKLRFAIYARWGEKVFETEDKRTGWDGRFKGQLLPMDVYAYTLDVEFADGKKYRKTGDITLIK